MSDSNGSIAVLDSKAKAAMEEMTPDLRLVFKQLETMNTKLNRGNVMTQWDMGNKIKRATSDVAKYGDRAIELLAEGLHVDAKRLYELKKFASMFTEMQLDRLLKKRTSDGQRISYTHLMLLATVDEDAALRKELTGRVFSEALTTRELALEIQKRVRNRENLSRAMAPKSPVAALMAANSYLEKWFDKQKVVEKNMSKLSKLGPDQCNEALEDRLRTTIERLEMTSEGSHKLAGELRDVHKHVVTLIERKAKEVADEAEESEESDDRPTPPRKTAKPKAGKKKPPRRRAVAA